LIALNISSDKDIAEKAASPKNINNLISQEQDFLKDCNSHPLQPSQALIFFWLDFFIIVKTIYNIIAAIIMKTIISCVI
jgi:hypothetical protein